MEMIIEGQWGQTDLSSTRAVVRGESLGVRPYLMRKPVRKGRRWNQEGSGRRRGKQRLRCSEPQGEKAWRRGWLTGSGKGRALQGGS